MASPGQAATSPSKALASAAPSGSCGEECCCCLYDMCVDVEKYRSGKITTPAVSVAAHADYPGQGPLRPCTYVWEELGVDVPGQVPIRPGGYIRWKPNDWNTAVGLDHRGTYGDHMDSLAAGRKVLQEQGPCGACGRKFGVYGSGFVGLGGAGTRDLPKVSDANVPTTNSLFVWVQACGCDPDNCGRECGRRNYYRCCCALLHYSYNIDRHLSRWIAVSVLGPICTNDPGACRRPTLRELQARVEFERRWFAAPIGRKPDLRDQGGHPLGAFKMTLRLLTGTHFGGWRPQYGRTCT